MVRNRQQAGDLFRAVGIAAGVLAACLFLHHYDPEISLRWLHCPFHAFTGLHCPGCGSLRAVHRLLNGEIFAALDMNPVTVLALPFLAYSFASATLGRLCRRPVGSGAIRPGLVWLLFGLIVAFGVLRNLPWYPFSALAPRESRAVPQRSAEVDYDRNRT